MSDCSCEWTSSQSMKLGLFFHWWETVPLLIFYELINWSDANHLANADTLVSMVIAILLLLLPLKLRPYGRIEICILLLFYYYKQYTNFNEICNVHNMKCKLKGAPISKGHFILVISFFHPRAFYATGTSISAASTDCNHRLHDDRPLMTVLHTMLHRWRHRVVIRRPMLITSGRVVRQSMSCVELLNCRIVDSGHCLTTNRADHNRLFGDGGGENSSGEIGKGQYAEETILPQEDPGEFSRKILIFTWIWCNLTPLRSFSLKRQGQLWQVLGRLEGSGCCFLLPKSQIPLR